MKKSMRIKNEKMMQHTSNQKSIVKSGVKWMSIMGLTVGVALSGFSMADNTLYGASGAASDPIYTLDEMLIYAIQDEYLAKAEYEAIMDTFGVQNPFSNISKSELTHINLLTPLFEAYDVAMPQDTSSEYTAVPATLAETFAVGVDAEIKNIAMYERFLATDLPDDVRLVFEKLMNASESHLKAFEKGLDRPTQTLTNNGKGRFGNQNASKNENTRTTSYGNINRY